MSQTNILKDRPSLLMVKLGAVGVGLLALLVLAATTVLASSPPGSVSNITGSRGTGTLTASWTAGSGADSYHVVYSSDNKVSWTAAATAYTGNSITISGLDDTKTYIVGVRSKNDQGGSGWVNSAPFTPSATNTPPNNLSGMYLQIDGRANGTLSFWWEHNQAGLTTTYDVVYSADNKASWTRAATDLSAPNCTPDQSNFHTTGSNDNHYCYTITGLDNNTNYIVAVRAKANNLYSNWYNSRLFRSMPSPTIMEIKQAACPDSSNYVLYIYGKNRTMYQYSTVKNYSFDLQYKVGSADWKIHNNSSAPIYNKTRGNSNVFWVHLDDVLPSGGNSYTVEVRGRYNKTIGGETVTGDWGGIVSEQMGTNSDTTYDLTRCVGESSNVVAAKSGSNVAVSWDAPETNLSLSYEVRYKINSGNWITNNNLIDLTTTSVTLSGLNLTDNDTVNVEVRTREYNSLSGAGDWVASNQLTWTSD